MVMGTLLSDAQGTFRNLDFESAQLVFIDSPTNHWLATTNALPGWSAFSETNQLANIQYGINGGITPSVWLSSQTNRGSIDGFFSVGLGETVFYTGSISQTGLVPANARSLLFEMITGGAISVSLGGQNLSYIAISNALNYTLYGADISSFAGQIETLNFSAVVNYGGGLLDDIQFSTLSVPEPSAISLIFLGSGVLFYVRHRKRFRL